MAMHSELTSTIPSRTPTTTTTTQPRMQEPVTTETGPHTTPMNDVPLEILELVWECSLFKSAPQSFVRELMAKLKVLQISAQEYITVEGEEAKAMYWLVKGNVCIASRDGESIYAELTPGQYFGEIGILFDRPRTASVITKSKCLVLALSSEVLRLVLPDYPTIDKEIRIKAQERLAELARMKDSLNGAMVVGQAKDRAMDLIESIPLLSLLPTTERQSLSKRVYTKTFGRFECIFQQGDRDKTVYFVVDGLVEVIDSADTVRALLSRGTMFGEFSFLGLSPCRTATIKTATDAEVLVIEPRVLASLCRKYVDLQTQLEELATSRQTRNHAHGFSTDHDPYNMKPEQPATTLSSPTSSCPSSPTMSATEYGDYSNSWEATPWMLEGGGGEQQQQQPSPRGVKRQASASMLHEPVVGGVSNSNQVIVRPKVKRPQYMKKNRRRTSLFNVGPFPDIIQIHIFQYMDLRTLVRMTRVCTHWQDLLTKSASLLPTLDLSEINTRVDDKSVKSIVHFAGNRPQHVNISNCFHLSNDGFSYLVNGLGINQLESFAMKSAWNVSDHAILDLTVPSIGRNLQEIDLSNCRRVNDATVARLIGWVVPDHQDHSYPPPGTVIGCPNLKRLTLSYCKHISDQCMYHMATYAAERIEQLDLTRCTGITDQGFQYWSQTMKTFNLKRLNLSDCTFLSDKAVISLAGVAKDLQELNLSFCCALTDVSVQVLALGCTRLKRLNLAYCGSAVSDTSLNMIALHLHQLEQLSIRGCIRVTRAGVDSVQMGCSKLKTIDYSQCRNVL